MLKARKTIFLPDASLLNKSSCLAPALSVTTFTICHRYYFGHTLLSYWATKLFNKPTSDYQLLCQSYTFLPQPNDIKISRSKKPNFKHLIKQCILTEHTYSLLTWPYLLKWNTKATIAIITKPCWSYAGAMLMPCLCHADAMLMPCWCHADAMLMPCWCHAGAVLEPCWSCPRAMLGPCWSHAGAMHATETGCFIDI